MDVRGYFEKWKEKGLGNISTFNLSNHYTTLFDDKEEGFEYMFKEMGIDIETLKSSNNPKLITLLEEIDDEMYNVGYLIESFIINNLLVGRMNKNFLDDVKLELDDLWSDVEEVYRRIVDRLGSVKMELDYLTHLTTPTTQSSQR